MATRLRSSLYLFQELRSLKGKLSVVLQPFLEQSQTAILNTVGNSDDAVPPDVQSKLRAGIDQIIASAFVGPDGRSTLFSDGRPVAAYGEFITGEVAFITGYVALAHAKYLWERLQNEPALLRWLQGSTSAFESFVQPSIMEATPRTGVYYEPPHRWVDPNGYRLSDRIWSTSVATRTRIDRFLADEIAKGTSAADLAEKLEQFLLPNRRGITTRRPYGRTASYDAVRLARSEVARAHSAASVQSASSNPFVTGIDWALSGSHPKSDICDRLATIGMGGERLRSPYDPQEAPIVVQDSHPQCICNNRPATGDTRKAIDKLIADRAAGNLALATPAQFRRYLRFLLEEYLEDVAIAKLLETGLFS